MNFTQIKASNKKWLIVISLILIWLIANFLHLYPVWLAQQQVPDDKFFTQQVTWFDPWDINVYTAAIQWGQQGHFLLRNIATTSNQPSSLFYPIYPLIGLATPNANAFVVFYGLSVLTRGIFILVVFWASKQLLKNNFWSIINTLITLFGGGLGWIKLQNVEASDLVISGVTSYTTLQRPHEALGISLYLISIILIYLLMIRPEKKLILLLAAVSSLLVVFYPYYLLIILILLALIIFFQKIKLKSILWMLTPIALTLVYLYHLQGTDLGSVSKLNLSKVGLFRLLLAHILLLPTAVLAMVKKRDLAQVKFLSVWYLIAIFLSFFPVGFSRFYLRPLIFPLAALSLLWIRDIWRKQRSLAWIVILSLWIYLPLTQFFIYRSRMQAINGDNPWVYQSQAFGQALAFTREKQLSNILTGYTSGNLIVAHTGKQVYLGHLIQTPNALKKQSSAASFYSNQKTEAEALDFLQKNNIEFVFYSSNEESMGKPEYSFLKPIFSQDEVKIYSWR